MSLLENVLTKGYIKSASGTLLEKRPVSLRNHCKLLPPSISHHPLKRIQENHFGEMQFLRYVTVFLAAVSCFATAAKAEGDGYGGEGVVIEPASGVAKGTIVLLHGLTANLEQMRPVATIGKDNGLENTRFILLQAPEAYVNFAQTTLTSWFNINALNPEAVEYQSEILAAAARVEKIVSGERRKSGIERVAVVGYSQGGAVATTVYMRAYVKLDCVVTMASWLPLTFRYRPGSRGWRSRRNKNAPALMIHGGADEVVNLFWGQSSARVMRDAGQTVDFRIREGESHSFSGNFNDVASTVVEYLNGRGF